MGLVRVKDRTHEVLRRLKHELSETNRKELSFDDTVAFLVDFYKRNKHLFEKLTGL